MQFRLKEAIDVLRRTPVALRVMLTDIDDCWILNNYGKDTFSPFDVVGHLIHADRTDWIPRARIILEHGKSRPFDTFDRYAQYEDSKGQTLAELLDTFEMLRTERIEALQAMRLTSEQLTLRGTHPELGSVTMEQLLAMWVVHDLNHIHQIVKCMAYQYMDAVGPWKSHAGVYK